ncbi:hypothetical protein INS49_007651 [Diaporthe citri]|uniref:uncharacterized protein n=1 Tax=Diaporthe citri TaxID=83186 RepID=UPI001C81F8DA|nr:uncharacterized protein INS49_007651 [Diaporthe citri]KAG6362559.1 hypothetical protein INS49_007651 [Diaporthe citri]
MPPYIEMSINHEVDDRSDGAPSDGDDTHDDDSWSPLDSIVRSKTFDLALRGNYTDWSPKAAFRELVQNWRDGIIESNDMSPADFCVYREEASAGRTTEIVFKAFERGADRSDVNQCRGFIRFIGHDGAGTVEITNRKATLQPWHLQIGGTSKRGAEDQAGAHGEGLKLAALVFLRSLQNNHLRCQSTGFNWNFNFKNNCLVVSAHRINMARKEARRPRKSTFKIATPEVVADKDVQFVIGESRGGRDETGSQVKRGPVQQTAFESWTKAALFLTRVDNEDTGIISTYHGDLLTAENLRGNIYLKGLLLSEGTDSRSASITGFPLRFGYNFAGGQTNRERESVNTTSEESRAMCQILSAAMKAKPDIIGDFVDILNTTESYYADVACAEKHWPREVGLFIRGYLLRGEFADRWFYSSEHMNKSPRLRQAIEGIGRKPYEVSKKCWDILEKKNLVRTAEEEALRRFKDAKKVPSLNISFGLSVYRLLQACIRACPQAPNTQVRFMRAGQLHIDVAISEDKRLLLVHELWLSMKDAVKELGLSGKMAEDKVVIFTVKNLFADVLQQLPRDAFQQERSVRSSEWHMKQEINRAEERLVNRQEMEVRVFNTSENGRSGLRVGWAVNARPQDDNVMIEVQCHLTSRCSGLRNNLSIAGDLPAEGKEMPCFPEAVRQSRPPTCRVRRVPFQQGAHCESGLEEGEEYFFVLVTPTDPNSFVSMSDNVRVVAQSGVEQAIAVSGASHQPSPKITPEKFSLESRLDTLDLLAVDTGRLYKAGNSKNVQAFIGFMKGEPSFQEESRKRRRVD